MNKEQKNSGQVAQLIRASSQYAKVMGLIPGKGTYKKQPMNAQVSGTTNRCLSLSLCLINFKDAENKKKEQNTYSPTLLAK